MDVPITWIFFFVIYFNQSLSFIFDLSSSTWELRNVNTSLNLDTIEGKVPGGVYSDLRRAGVLQEDIYFSTNDVTYRWVGLENWTYTKTFKTPEDPTNFWAADLVFEGLDTFASVALNGQKLGGTDNMFVRYSFPIKHLLKSESNKLVVNFTSAVNRANQRHQIKMVPPECYMPMFEGECHVNQIRKMQASFGWDWGPAFPGSGIWKPVYIEFKKSATINDVLINTRRNSDFWELQSTFHYEIDPEQSKEVVLEIKIEFENGNLATKTKKFVCQENCYGEKIEKLELKIPYDSVKLWWPNGMGDQTLYKIILTLNHVNSKLNKELKIGFRTLELIEKPVIPENPEKGLTFYFEVNSVPMFAKGTNWIPAHALPEEGSNPDYPEHLLRSSAEAGFNMLRVWGGGVYESEHFYQLCDELGLLVWQDFMFACALYPVDKTFLSSVEIEVRQQVRRLQYRPCMAVWAGNNEVEQGIKNFWFGNPTVTMTDEYRALFGDLINKIVLAEDPMAIYLTTSPGSGLKEYRNNAFPNGSSNNGLFGDVHFYQYEEDALNPATYEPARFVSEFGYQSLPSLRLLKASARPGELEGGIDSSLMMRRQHHPGGNGELVKQVMDQLLPVGHFSFGDESKLKHLIYLTQFHQALAVKTEAESHRRGRGLLDANTGDGFTMGSLYWQLNDIWPAPSWSSIEFDGTWKPLHYFASKFYSKILVSPLMDNERNLIVHVANDGTQNITGILEVEVHSWNSLENAKGTKSLEVLVPAADATKIYKTELDSFLANSTCDPLESCFLYFRLLNDSNGKILSQNFLLPYKIKEVIGIQQAQIKIKSVEISREEQPTERYQTIFTIALETDRVAPFVWLDAQKIKGRFSDNGFFMLRREMRVSFFALQSVTVNDLKEQLEVSSLADHF